MSDSKGAAIDEIKLLVGKAELIGEYKATDKTYDVIPPLNEVTKAILAILAQEVNKARLDELTNFEPFFKGDHSKCPDARSCIGYQNAQSDFDNEKEIRLSKLRGAKL